MSDNAKDASVFILREHTKSRFFPLLIFCVYSVTLLMVWRFHIKQL